MAMSRLRQLTAADIMVHSVVTAQLNQSIARIADMMERHKIGSVVIMENRKPVGILTERDFARIVRHGILNGRDRAKHQMTRPVVTVKSNKSVADIIKLMRRKHIKHLPVVDKRLHLVGIISARDLAKAMIDILSL